MKKFILILTAFAALSYATNAQTGEIKGKVHDSKSKETLPKATIFVKYGDKTISTISDLDGNFTIKPLQPGRYNLFVSYLGYDTLVMEKIVVNIDNITFLNNLALDEVDYNEISGVTFIEYVTPIIDPINSHVITNVQIKNLADKTDIKGMIANLTPGVQKTDNGELSFRGARVGDAAYYVDGVKCNDGNLRVPSGCIKSMTVYNGGIPAKYGDTTGGCVVIETMNYFDYYNAQNR